MKKLEGIFYQTDQAIADSNGVSKSWVKQIRHEMVGEKCIGAQFATRDQKREIAREYISTLCLLSHWSVSGYTDASDTPVIYLKWKQDTYPLHPE